MKTVERIADDWLLATEIQKLEARLWRGVKRDRTQVVLMTSAVRGEGKTTTTAYLATALAMHPERRIAIVDLDFREPRINAHFECEVRHGIGEVLAGRGALPAAIIKTELPQLDLALPVPGGEDPGLLRRAREIGETFDHFRSHYDLTLVDAPALLPVADTSAILPHTDGVLLVAMAGKTTKPHLNRAREICLGLNANILGLIVGNLKEAAPEYVDSGYYYGYR